MGGKGGDEVMDQRFGPLDAHEVCRVAAGGNVRFKVTCPCGCGHLFEFVVVGGVDVKRQAERVRKHEGTVRKEST